MKRFILTTAIAAVCLLAISTQEANARWRVFRRWGGGCGPGGCSPAPQAVKPAPPVAPAPAPAVWFRGTDQPPVAPAK